MVILDSSVVFKWFNETEINTEAAFSILNEHITGENLIWVPDLIFYELTNAWATKSELKIKQIYKCLRILDSYNLKILQVDFKLLEKIVNFSKTYKVSVYDAIYAVIAQENKCDLITADDRFTDRVNLNFVKKLSSYKN